MCLSAQTFKLLPVPHRQHCPPTLAQKHSAGWVFSLAITASEFAVTDEKIAFPKKKKKWEREREKKHVCLPTRPCQVWHRVAQRHVQTRREEKIWLIDWCWTARCAVSMTSDRHLKMHPRKHTSAQFLHLLKVNVGQIWQWQSWEYVSSQIYSTWEEERI